MTQIITLQMVCFAVQDFDSMVERITFVCVMFEVCWSLKCWGTRLILRPCPQDCGFCGERCNVEFNARRLPVWLQVASALYGPFHASSCHWSLTTQAQVQFQAILFWICGGENCTQTGVSPRNSVFLCQYYFISAPYSCFIHHPWCCIILAADSVIA
jgi:hypothetical protein